MRLGLVGSEGTQASEAGRSDGDARASISRRLVGLHKEFDGRGPTRAKTYINGDLVVVLMRGGFTPVEETLLREGAATLSSSNAPTSRT
jgi:uncharacterized protein YbcI